ncbi:MAG TPA: thiol reductant ABC exporter subunit CydC [Acidimicrobiales bacterium]|nr:thiol reductant ABC exporter subunit CydC [Acidimicrobiales bacterium]
MTVSAPRRAAPSGLAAPTGTDHPGGQRRRTLRSLLAIGAPPARRLAAAGVLGSGAVLATIGLLAGSGYVVDRAALRPGLGAIAGILALVEVLAFVRAPLRYGERLAAHDAAFRALGRWRVWLYDVLEPRSPAALGRWRRGDLLARAIEDVDALQDLYLRGAVPVVVALVASAAAVSVVGLVLPPAAPLLGGALAAALLVSGSLALAASPLGEREAALRGSLSAEVVDLLQGAPELVAFGADAQALGRLRAVDDELARLHWRRSLLGGAASTATLLCAGAAVVGVLAEAVAAARGHRLAPTMLAALPLAAIGAFEAVPPVTLAAHRLGDVLAAGRRLLALRDVPVPVADPIDPVPLPGGTPELALREARLRYHPELPWALDGVSLVVAPGRRLAVTGPNGAGKTSLVNVLLRFWPLQSGEASLGGVRLEAAAQADARRVMSLVEQEAPLFAGSIRDNVTLGRPDAGDAEVAAALRAARLDAWVRTLPDGLATPVGELGSQVSGGQRQRIALARALVAGGGILLLDEPTTGLDRDEAAAVLGDVLEAAGPRSVLLVTHRPEEVEAFDDVAVMDAGRVVEFRPGGSAQGAGGNTL